MPEGLEPGVIPSSTRTEPGQWVSLAGAPGGSASQATLVVGYDGQPGSRDTLRVVTDLGRRLMAHIEVVHAVDMADYPIDPDRADWEQQARDTLDRERAEVAAALSHHKTGWTYRAGHGDAAALLTAVANEHDALMIIVGTRGEGWRASLERLLSASVSHRVIQRCQRPVLVVSPFPIQVTETSHTQNTK